MSDTLVLTGRWVFPGTAPPLERGTVSVRGDRIVAVSDCGERSADIDLGNVALIPGLVNAHTHLDLTGLRGKLPPTADFIGWLKGVIDYRRTVSPESALESARAGRDEALRFGTTLLGDIAAGGCTFPLLAESPCWSVVFREMIGLRAERAMPVWREAVDWLNHHEAGERCRGALSPHSPYSVHQSLIRATGAVGVMQTIHLAESRAELELLDRRRGPFVEFLRELGVFDEDGLAPSLEWVLWQTQRSESVLYAHGNYLDPATALPANSTIVYCPRTHAAFGHAPHPFREFIARGVRVALGTDSLASSPDLDILAEARFIHDRHPDFPGEQLLRMATLAGAEALGFAEVTGSLVPGKSADLVAVPLPDEEAVDPYRLLFGSGERTDEPRRTMWRGSWR